MKMFKIENDEIKVVVTDLDGTLLPMSQNELSRETKKYLNKITNDGIFFILNTGNLPKGAKWVIEEFQNPINQYTRYFIGNSGIVLHDFLTDESVVEGQFNNQDVLKIYQILIKHHVHFNITSIDLKTIFLSHEQDLQLKNKNPKTSKQIHNYQLLTNEILKKIQSPKIVFSTESDEKYYQIILELDLIFGEKYSSMSWMPKAADLIVSGHNKYTGLKQMIQKINEDNNLNLTMNNVVYFGDQLNDLPVFQQHKYSIAVNNAIDEIKKLAYDTTDSSENDGLIKYLKKIEN